jgi:hypothetical protein
MDVPVTPASRRCRRQPRGDTRFRGHSSGATGSRISSQVTVYEHGETFELVFARSAAVIRADGTLAA